VNVSANLKAMLQSAHADQIVNVLILAHAVQEEFANANRVALGINSIFNISIFQYSFIYILIHHFLVSG
jgi:hypothetical protein